MLDQLEQVHIWDIVIIGGGATGLGASVDAADDHNIPEMNLLKLI